MVSVWTPFDVPSKKIRYLIFLLQYCTGACVLVPAMVIAVLIWQSTDLIAVHIEQLISQFHKLLDEDNKYIRKQALRSWIIYHNNIIR